MDPSEKVIFNSIILSDLLKGTVKSIKQSENRLAFDYELIPVAENNTPLWWSKEPYSTVGLIFKLKRNNRDRTRIYVQFNVPTGIFASISHIAFFIDSSQVPGRLGSLLTLYLISVNSYNSLDAPSNRGLSYVDLWFLGIQFIFIFGIVEYGSILCFRRIMTFRQRRIEESKLQKIDFCAFVTSSISFTAFIVVYYFSINSFTE